MGCGASSGDITQPVTEGVLGDMVKTIDNLGPAAITSAKQLTQEVLEGPILGRPQDEKRTVARTGTEGTREPPNGEVVDGLLGTSVSDLVCLA